MGWRRFLLGGLTLIITAAGWFLFAPEQFGGSVSYAIINGNSMEPRLQRGDLAIIQEQDSYKPGDAVAYRSAQLDRIVLHRIVAREGQRFVLKGDNNDFVDSDRPQSSEVIGELWVRVPALGGVLERIAGNPLWTGLLVAVLFAAAFWGTKKRSRLAIGSRTAASLRWVTREQALAGAGTALVAFASLAAFAYSRPTTSQSTTQIPYEHQGSFDYTASVPKGPVYPGGEIESDDPVFLSIAKRIELTFTYEFVSDADSAVSGSGQLVAEVSNQEGWSRTLPLTPSIAVRDGGVELDGILDVERILRVTNRVEKLTAVAVDTYTVTIRAPMSVSGTVQSTSVDESFSPEYAFSLNHVVLKPRPNEEATPRSPVQKGSITVATHKPSTFEAVGFSIAFANARRLGLLGMVVGLAGVAGALLLFPGGSSEPGVRYRGRMIAVDSAPPESADPVFVQDLPDLMRLAEQYECVVLHYVHEDGDKFFFDHGGVFYSFDAERRAAG